MKKTNLTLAEVNGAMEMMMARIFVKQNGELSENDLESLKHTVGLCKYMLDISKEVEEAKHWIAAPTVNRYQGIKGAKQKRIDTAMKNLTEFQKELYGSIF